jgi:hypothetical protein
LSACFDDGGDNDGDGFDDGADELEEDEVGGEEEQPATRATTTLATAGTAKSLRMAAS